MFEIREGYISIPLPKKDACKLCGEVHDGDEPHNRNSLLYRHRFWKEHRRYPTWEDAMSHCGEKMKEKWIRKLEKKGINISGTEGTHDG